MPTSTALSPSRPLVLAPAGDWECARAAVENGADAIYFGLTRFNARMRAGNFSDEDLPRLMRFLHERGARGYLTFNTLTFADELADAARFLEMAMQAQVDAAIVQDVGICRLIRATGGSSSMSRIRSFPVGTVSSRHGAGASGASAAGR